MRVDVHQHIWSEPLIEALAARTTLPCIVRSDGVTVLHCGGEQPYVIDLSAESTAHRTALLAEAGVDRALIALSSAIGIEALRRDAATELIEAHLEGVEALGEPFGVWGPVALDAPDPDDVDRLLARGCVGISLPAGALTGHEALEVADPLLERAAALGLPAFVHPGHAPGQQPPEVAVTDPLWWQPLTGYVSQMQAAWLRFATEGRRRHPELVIVFAMLAGGAPLLAERLSVRGGPAVDLADTLTLYDSSSFGPIALHAVAEQVGESQIVYGSDRPVVEPVPNVLDAALKANGARLLSPATEDAALGAA